MRIAKEYYDIFIILEKEKIQYCLLRPDEPLEEIQKDLDLFIDPKSFNTALRILNALGYSIARTEYFNPRKVVMCKWSDGNVIFLDIHFALIIKGIEYLDAVGVLKRRIRKNCWYELGPSDMATVLLVHDIVGKGFLQSKYLPKLKILLSKDFDQRTVEDLKKFGISHLIPQQWNELNPITQNAQLAQEFKRSLVKNILLKKPYIAIRLLFLWIKKFFRIRKGISVCFVGPDGAGKTTTIENFKACLTDKFGYKVMYHYLGPWGHYKFKFTRKTKVSVPATLKGLLSERKQLICKTGNDAIFMLPKAVYLEYKRLRRCLTDDEDAMRRKIRKLSYILILFRFFRGHIKYWIFMFVLLFELYYRYFLVMLDKYRGRVVLCDRYIFDLLSGAMHSLTNRYHFLRFCMCYIYPKADITVFLNGDPQLLAARKKDLDIETMYKMIELYKKLQKRWKFISVKTDVPPNDVISSMMQQLSPKIIAGMKT